MNNNVVVQLINVGKKYGDKQLFQGINQVIKPGQCLVITGPNGSGKSTLLKMIAGVIKPSAGRISIGWGEGFFQHEESMGYIGMVSPEIVFYQGMTGVENVVFLSRCRGIACSLQYASELCAAVGLSGYSNKQLCIYSTGMKQRLKFAIMLAIQPSLWLLDEPSSNLDGKGKEIIKDIIDTAIKQMATVIIATNECWEMEYASAQITLA